jgi:hypothetical protein
MIVWTYRIADDFAAMIQHQVAMTDKFHGSAAQHVVERGVEVNMFERCAAMCAFVHSDSFTAPTVFLDNDAFPNADLRPAFDQIADVGLTVRDTPGLMPVNEGVIFALPTEGSRAFFQAYHDEYAASRNRMSEKDWKWWGGQAALNAIDHSSAVQLPCDTYNFSPDGPMSRAELDGKAIIHLKGPRKALFDQVRQYQEARCASQS